MPTTHRVPNVAQRRTVILVDDVDASTADETVTFALDGVTYEIDLSSRNAQQLRAALQPWMDSARRTGGGRRRTTSLRS